MQSEWFDNPGGEAVELSLSDAVWAEEAASWMARIRDAIALPEARIEHVGSTSVSGLIAKPVLDIQVAVPGLEAEELYRPGLESVGLVLRQRSEEHRFFRPPAGKPRTIHVHVCQIGSKWEHDHVLFRDRLRADPDLAIAYAQLKRELAMQFSDDRLAYNSGKTRFILDAISNE